MPSRGTTQTSRPLASVFLPICGTGSGLSAPYAGKSLGKADLGPAWAAVRHAIDNESAISVLRSIMSLSSVLGGGGGLGRRGGRLQHRGGLAIDDRAVGRGQVGL